MVYTNKSFPNKEFEFPPPPTWLTWMGEWTWDRNTGGTSDKHNGPIRHHESLYKAKQYVGRYANGSSGFSVNWAIYEWTGEKYEKRFEASQGDIKRDHVLFAKTKIAKPKVLARAATDDELAEVLASIEASMNTAGVKS